MADSSPPSMEGPGINPNPYDLDDLWMICSFISCLPLSNIGVASCIFQAIPLRNFGFHFRRLSDYGTIFHESPERLVIVINHRDPGLIMRVVRHAWVNEYLELGDRGMMRFGPLVPYQDVEVTFERVEPEPSHGTRPDQQPELQEQTQAQSTAPSNSITSSENTTPQGASPLEPESED
ncbi:hypothetical protein F4811DRAFT_456453 [Daldinia bambusicola]|nr:hypothetical protein F4811DRAFT_456453 [Daldinia bambusicola]